MRPPDTSPQAWYDKLPILPNSVDTQTYAIYTGEVNTVSNLIVRLDSDGVLHVVNVAVGSSDWWTFNYEEGVVETVHKAGADWSLKIVNQSGRPFTSGGAVSLGYVNMSMITAKFSPA